MLILLWAAPVVAWTDPKLPIPAILYAVKPYLCRSCRSGEDQFSVAWFVLQVPQSSSKLYWWWTKAHWNDARTLGYLQALTNRKKDLILNGVVTMVLEGVTEPWSAQAKALTQMVGLSTLVGVSKARVSTQMEMWSICKVQTMIKEHPYLVNLSEP